MHGQLDGREHQRGVGQRQLDRRGLPLGRRDLGHRRQAARPRQLLGHARAGRELHAARSTPRCPAPPRQLPRDRPHRHLQPGPRGRRRGQQHHRLARALDVAVAELDARRPAQRRRCCRARSGLPDRGPGRPDAALPRRRGQRHQHQRGVPAPRRGADPAAFDAAYTGPLSQELTAVVPDTEPGVYYVLVRGFSGPADDTPVTLTADLLPLAITDVDTDVGGDSKLRHHHDQGRAVPRDAIVKLGPPGHRRVRAGRLKVVDSSDDHRHVRLHRRAARAVRPEGHQPRRRRRRSSPYRFLIERAIEPDVTIGVGGPRVILAGDAGTYSVALQNLSQPRRALRLLPGRRPRAGQQPVSSTACRSSTSTPTCAARPKAPRAARTTPAVDQPRIDHQHRRPAADLRLPVRPRRPTGFAGFTFNVATYPGLKEMHDRAFEAFRTQITRAFPQHDELLAEGEGNLDAWWEAVKETVDEALPGAGRRSTSSTSPASTTRTPRSRASTRSRSSRSASTSWPRRRR